VLNGRYGPYITDKARNAKIPKDKDPKSLTLTECQTMLAAAPARTFGKWGRKAKGANGKDKTANAAAKAAANGNGQAAPRKKRTAKNIATAPAPNARAPAPGRAAPGRAAPGHAAPGHAAPARLAAKGARASADKKASVKSPAASQTAPKAGLKTKKSSAKKKP
jgi:DNA topoisomerase I